MLQLLLRADGVLRRRRWGADPAALPSLVAIVVVFGMIYGGVMGSYSALSTERAWQILFSAVKVPLMLLATFAISLPSFMVLNTLLGLRDDLADALRAVLATQAALAIILASLAPVTAFVYLSAQRYFTAVAFNGLMFAVASFSAQIVLHDYYQRLIARNPRHRWMVRLWALVYVFVGIQMAWILRPFIGDPTSPVEFLRPQRWDNAYLKVVNLVWQVIEGWL